MFNQITRQKFLLLCVFLAFFIAACDSHAGYEAAQATPQPFPVDKLFKEIYQTLGGIEVLGPAISSVQEHGSLKCQYTEAALFCFDPNATGPDRVRLANLGSQLVARKDPPIDGLLSDANTRVVDGIVIHEEFVPLYDRMYGARYVGRPLTRMRINNDLQQVEQFFENVGFYRKLNDPTVHLITYGAFFCGQACSYNLDQYWGIVKSNLIEQPFAQSIARLGGSSIFGEPLLQPRKTEDGFTEQVYTNGIFYGLPNDPGVVQMRPLADQLGYFRTNPVPKKSHEKLVFNEIKPGLGYNVLLEFDHFIAHHGGRDLSGEPISEVIKVDGQNLYRQCFTNYCLIYDPAASSSLRVRMMALGQEYNNRYPPAPGLRPQDIFTPERILISTSADKPNLGIGQEQVIRIVTQWRDNQQPLDRVEGKVVVNYPNNVVAQFSFPPTDSDGRSKVVIPARSGLKHGDRVTYQVCLNLPSERFICDMQSYLIWDVR